jgi:hypothetical protein
MEFKDLFEAIEYLFVEILFIPFDFIRLDISNWFIQNAINFSLMIVISAALVYWTLELIKYDPIRGREKRFTRSLWTMFEKSVYLFRNMYKQFKKFILSILL